MIRIAIRIRDTEEILQFQEHDLLVTWPLDDATASGQLRTFRRNRTKAQRVTLVSCKIRRGTERPIAPIVYNFNIYFFGRKQTKIQRLTSVSGKQCHGTERSIAR